MMFEEVTIHIFSSRTKMGFSIKQVWEFSPYRNETVIPQMGSTALWMVRTYWNHTFKKEIYEVCSFSEHKTEWDTRHTRELRHTSPESEKFACFNILIFFLDNFKKIN